MYTSCLLFICTFLYFKYLFDAVHILANSPYFGGRLLILTSYLCRIDKHNFFIIAPNRVG